MSVSYRVSLKKVKRFSSNFCSRIRILLFHMCFGIRISSPFHLATPLVIYSARSGQMIQMNIICNGEQNIRNLLLRRQVEHFTCIIHCMEDHSKNLVRACVFSVFRAIKILNVYNWSGQMKLAQNSDSKTHVKK